MKFRHAFPAVLIAAIFSTGPATAFCSEDLVVEGGVGLDARADLSKDYARYNLHLAFANAAGEYLADVSVVIRDAGGNERWRSASAGPFVFARVPVGNYLISAERGGLVRSRWIKARPVPGRLHDFRWP